MNPFACGDATMKLNTDVEKLKSMANAIRALSLDAVKAANSGHTGMPLGAADMATVLFTQFMKVDPSSPHWADRDRFVLSAGHGSMLLYSLLFLMGYEDITLDEIKNFRQLGAKTAGHPEFGHAAGIETTTGPLGQGIATAVGMALGERLMNGQFGDDLVDHFTYVIAGDGDLMEGVSHEAISLAGHLKLNKLIVLWDDNGISIDGPLSLTESGDMGMRFKAAGWNVLSVDGHNMQQVADAIEKAQQADAPTLIACKTTIGYGAPTLAGTSKAHGAITGDDEIAGVRAAIGWSHPPFEIPTDVLDAWRLAGLRGVQAHKAWGKRLEAADGELRGRFNRVLAGELPTGLENAVLDLKKQLIEAPKAMASRSASELVLNVITPIVPEMIGGSADLTGSNNTKAKHYKPVTAGDFSGQYIYYGIREHGMAAAMNGLALHGGLIPFGGTFLVFSDYARPAVRLSALMGQRVVYVFTHDSIGLGEDGPTHQPVEHMPALRAMPNLHVLRPSDATEVAECWQIALDAKATPSVLALSRQNIAPVRTIYTEKNLCKRGAYELSAASSEEAQVSLFASGSEVPVALEAQASLEKQGVATRVVSVPSFDLFFKQSDDYRAATIGDASVNIAIEAAVRFGWDSIIGTSGIFIGMEGFGASAPAEKLYQHFGITAEATVKAALARLASKA